MNTSIERSRTSKVEYDTSQDDISEYQRNIRKPVRDASIKNGAKSRQKRTETKTEINLALNKLIWTKIEWFRQNTQVIKQMTGFGSDDTFLTNRIYIFVE